MDGTFSVDEATRDEIVAHARSDTPFEVCGLLAGPVSGAGAPGSAVARVYRIPNADRSMTAYSMEPKAMLKAFDDMDEQGWDLLAIYHSHPHTEAFPSPTDVGMAFYPDAVYLICSLQDPEAPVLRAFNIRDGKITERELFIAGEPAPAGPR